MNALSGYEFLCFVEDQRKAATRYTQDYRRICGVHFVYISWLCDRFRLLSPAEKILSALWQR